MCIFVGYSDTSKAYRVWDLPREQLVITRSVALDERPPIRYTDVVVLSESFAQCKHFHDENDEVKVGVPDSNNTRDAEDMNVDDTADIITSWEDIVVDASGNLNQSHTLAMIATEGCTDIQPSNTTDAMTSRTLSETVVESGNNGTHMLPGIPDPSRAIVRCVDFHPLGTRL